MVLFFEKTKINEKEAGDGPFKKQFLAIQNQTEQGRLQFAT